MKTNKEHTFEYSVVVPLQQGSVFPERGLESIASQSIGFRENIGIVFVVPDILMIPEDCKRWHEAYPENVTVTSPARIAKAASGRFIAILNHGWTWAEDAFAGAREFFDSHSDDAGSFAGGFDVCSCRIIYDGELSHRTHPLDYRFEKGTRICDLREEPEMAPSAVCSMIVRKSAFIQTETLQSYLERQFKGRFTHDAEDPALINTLYLANPAVGLAADICASSSERSGETDRRERILKFPGYSRMAELSEAKYGEVLPFISKEILYDMRCLCKSLRKASAPAESMQTDAQLETELSEKITEALTLAGDDAIKSAKGMNQYQRLSLFDRKYGRHIIGDATLNKAKYAFNGTTVLNLHAKSLIDIKVLDIRDGMLVIEGLTRLNAAEREHTLYARAVTKDSKENKYEAEHKPYSRSDITGCLGEVITEGIRYRIALPAENLQSVALYVTIDGAEIALKPAFDKYIGLGTGPKNEYIIKGGYIITTEGGKLLFGPDTWSARKGAEWRLTKEMVKAEGFGWEFERRKALKLRRDLETAPLQNKVLFITTRSDDKLIDNMAKVYDALDLPKEFFAKTDLAKVPEYTEKAARLVSTSKVVVTDNYLVSFRDLEKKPGQKYVQLWHSTGFAKHFGQDGSDIFPPKDALFHRDYDLVTASSDGVRYTYASAFGIPVDRIEATGIARTDDFFDDEYIAETRAKVLEQHPEFEGKQLIVYAPSFRDIPGVPRARFVPELDFSELSKNLKENQIFTICPHPLMTDEILPGSFDNIKEIRDLSTAQMMYAADILVTDYSSVMFDFSLLRRPMAFFCYDYDSYDRDFYMDFDTELPGPLLRTQEELFSYLKQDEYPMIEDFDAFYEKNLGACDGHSTERIAKRIEDLFCGR